MLIKRRFKFQKINIDDSIHVMMNSLSNVAMHN